MLISVLTYQENSDTSVSVIFYYNYHLIILLFCRYEYHDSIFTKNFSITSVNVQIDKRYILHLTSYTTYSNEHCFQEKY